MIVRLIAVLVFMSALVGYARYLPEPVHAAKLSNFTKVGSNGKIMGAWQGPWACVHDSATGLLWEVKSDSESIHDGYWTYSWFDGNEGVANWGDCYFEKDRCDVSDLIRRANQEKTCGREDWRLPTGSELMSLVSHDARPGEPRIDKGFFPHTKKGDYWTIDSGKPLTGTFAHLKTGADAVNFGDARLVTLPYRNAAFVRLVSGESN